MLYLLSFISSILAFFVIYNIIAKKSPKKYFLLAIYIELIVILALLIQDIAIFGLMGLMGIIPLIISNKNSKR